MIKRRPPDDLFAVRKIKQSRSSSCSMNRTLVVASKLIVRSDFWIRNYSVPNRCAL